MTEKQNKETTFYCWQMQNYFFFAKQLEAYFFSFFAALQLMRPVAKGLKAFHY